MGFTACAGQGGVDTAQPKGNQQQSSSHIKATQEAIDAVDTAMEAAKRATAQLRALGPPSKGTTDISKQPTAKSKTKDKVIAKAHAKVVEAETRVVEAEARAASEIKAKAAVEGKGKVENSTKAETIITKATPMASADTETKSDTRAKRANDKVAHTEANLSKAAAAQRRFNKTQQADPETKAVVEAKIPPKITEVSIKITKCKNDKKRRMKKRRSEKHPKTMEHMERMYKNPAAAKKIEVKAKADLKKLALMGAKELDTKRIFYAKTPRHMSFKSPNMIPMGTPAGM